MGTDPMLCVAFSANKQVCCARKLLANHFVSFPVLFASPYFSTIRENARSFRVLHPNTNPRIDVREFGLTNEIVGFELLILVVIF